MVKRFGLGKSERLKSRKQIEELFLSGNNFSQFPIRVSYQFEASEKPTFQIGVSASKKYFKKAVDRNRIKRLLREAYRVQKHLLLDALKEKNISGKAFFIYTDKVLPEYTVLLSKMKACLELLAKKANERHS